MRSINSTKKAQLGFRAVISNYDKELFQPYEKNHSTAYDAEKIAERLGVKNLLLYHTEDFDLENRAKKNMQKKLCRISKEIYLYLMI